MAIKTCAITGLALRASCRQRAYRLAKPSYGPLNPILRGQSSHSARDDWNRFDLPGTRTIYAATTLEGAYGELLGHLKQPAVARAAGDYLDGVDDVALYQLIADDWKDMGKLPPGVVDIDWLYEHRIYTIALPDSGWFVEIESARSITYMNQHLPQSLCERGVGAVTTSELHSSERDVTTALAETIARTTLFDQTQPVGVHYSSKHGVEWTCWAVWLRENTSGAIKTDAGGAVEDPSQNLPLTEVLESYNLRAG